MFRIAYNTNGLAHHRLPEAFALLAQLGYEGVAVTPDVGHLDPLDPDPGAVRGAAEVARELGLTLSVETGARFVLDPRRKHYPTLLEDDAAARERRIDFTRACIDLAVGLDAEVVSLWAGSPPGGGSADAEAPPPNAEELWDRLVAGLRPVLSHARERGRRIAFEPEPGMFVERPAGYLELVERLGPDADLGLCLDVGHLLCTGDLPVERVIRDHADHLRVVHLDDIAGGIHEHRMFGEGDLELGATLSALREVGFDGLAAVELSRDSHRGAWAAAEAMLRIREFLPSA